MSPESSFRNLLESLSRLESPKRGTKAAVSLTALPPPSLLSVGNNTPHSSEAGIAAARASEEICSRNKKTPPNCLSGPLEEFPQEKRRRKT